jgi:hypothetical protein
MYPNALIAGVEVDAMCLQNCVHRFRRNPRVHISHSRNLAPNLKFDLILCFNVLCKFPAEIPLSFENYVGAVVDLYTKLSLGGSLLVYGGNYKIAAVKLPQTASYHLLKGIGPGLVEVYDHRTNKKYGIRSEYRPMYVLKAPLPPAA